MHFNKLSISAAYASSVQFPCIGLLCVQFVCHSCDAEEVGHATSSVGWKAK